jgi:hypothetical protein
VPVGVERKKSKIEKKEKYEDEVKALARHFGGLQAGTTGLCITLQEILKICPRDRKRSDAYNGLISYLASKKIELTIKSRKHGRKDKYVA